MQSAKVNNFMNITLLNIKEVIEILNDTNSTILVEALILEVKFVIYNVINSVEASKMWELTSIQNYRLYISEKILTELSCIEIEETTTYINSNIISTHLRVLRNYDILSAEDCVTYGKLLWYKLFPGIHYTKYRCLIEDICSTTGKFVNIEQSDASIQFKGSISSKNKNANMCSIQ